MFLSFILIDVLENIRFGTAIWPTVCCVDFVVILTCFTDHLSGLIKLLFDEVHLDPPDCPPSMRDH